ncbi:MAG: AAA family ATPase [Proteobacteria bacterium]|nr:AAA family ATPase [Pseudomonadota bacterium]
MPATRIQLQLHGVAHWRHGSGPPRALERKHAALLAWLWVEGATPRSRLAGLLWPEASEDRARGNLRQRLLKLRQEAGELLADQAGVLSLKPDVAVAPPDPPGATLLQALEFDDCETFARWLEGRREATRERRKREWLAEVREAAASQRLDDALYAADQLLQADRESEEAYRVLMEVSYLRGDHAAALNAWDRCRDMLRQLYGVQPTAATQQLGQTILQAAQQAEAAQAELAAWAPTPALQQPLPPSVLRPPRLVGRQGELQTLVAAWQAGHALVVAGVAGVGKSRLLAEWQATLGAPGVPGMAPGMVACTAAAAARPGDAVLPYASLSRLLLSALERFKPDLTSPHALQAARLLPRLATLAGLTAEPVRTDYERTQALLALARLLGDCVASGCLAFVLDDLQFADPASLAALRVLAGQAGPIDQAGPIGQVGPAGPTGCSLRFALGLRADESGAEAQALLKDLADGGSCTRVDLQPLAEADAAALLHSLAVPALQGGRWAPQIWQQVGGNPAFLLESVKLLLTTAAVPGGDAALPLPASIEAVIQRRLELLSPRARHLAQLAALAGSGYSVPLAAAALACAPIELSEPLRELERRQVFYGRQFVHDVIASVTARSVPPAVAEFMHRFVAEHLQAHGGDAAHVATHWLACGEWRRAGQAFHQAAQAAGAAALANEQAALLDQAIAAFEREPAAQAELFSALEERANVYESNDHEGLRPGFIARLRQLARTEAQQLSVLNHHNGWLANLAQPIEEAAIERGIARAPAVGRPDLAWSLARMLALHRAMNDRAADALALLAEREPWVTAEGGAAVRLTYRLTRSSIFAFGDRLAEALEDGHLAIAAAHEAQDWPQALPAMSNVGVMHYWRGEYPAARAVLTQARELRERLYGSSGSGIKIDIHLGAVLYECGEPAAAQALLQGAVQEMARWPDNEYRRTECLLADNHLAQIFIARGQADDAARVLAHGASGVADRFYGRRLALRLRWQRCFGQVDNALVQELQALAARVASPFNRALMELELTRQAAPAAALPALQALAASAVVQQRPGLQLHVAVLACHAARALGDAPTAAAQESLARSLLPHCGPFDMGAAEAQALLA